MRWSVLGTNVWLLAQAATAARHNVVNDIHNALQRWVCHPLYEPRLMGCIASFAAAPRCVMMGSQGAYVACSATIDATRGILYVVTLGSASVTDKIRRVDFRVAADAAGGNTQVLWRNHVQHRRVTRMCLDDVNQHLYVQFITNLSEIHRFDLQTRCWSRVVVAVDAIAALMWMPAPHCCLVIMFEDQTMQAWTDQGKLQFTQMVPFGGCELGSGSQATWDPREQVIYVWRFWDWDPTWSRYRVCINVMSSSLEWLLISTRTKTTMTVHAVCNTTGTLLGAYSDLQTNDFTSMVALEAGLRQHHNVVTKNYTDGLCISPLTGFCPATQ